MASSSPAALVKRIDGQVSMIIRGTDWDNINEKGRKAVAELRQDLSDARIYSQYYELSEMRDEQIDNAKKAKKYLARARKCILRASEFDVFSAIDVAHLSAQIDQLIGDLN
jgi:activator of HSP90 ATPase